MEGMNAQENVFVAMSGGVDSAVTAALLLERGYQVTGIHMSTWVDPKWAQATEDQPSSTLLALAVAESLGIPFIDLDVRDQFYQQVVQTFIRQYLAGRTPNPCLFCNPQVKWGILQTYALERGASFFATGHYARLHRDENSRVHLLKGIDSAKDQSYVLSMLTQDQLNHTLFPLGGMTKETVREKARHLDLTVADRQDSQDLCFLGGGNYRDFLARFAPESSNPGEIVDLEGEVLGQHEGLAFYTIGQRKGIRVAAGEPYYVVRKDIENNWLVVGFDDQVGKRTLAASGVNWIAGEAPHRHEIYEVMIRYRSKPIMTRIIDVGTDDFRLEFKENVRGITPGQVAVLYRGDECLGSGVIQEAP
jgi:tRNA-specific 2-thiouridylase